MTPPADHRPPNEAARRRLEEIERRFAAAGLVTRRGPRPLDEAQIAGEPRPAMLRLADVLRELGPVYMSFGRYLARRSDLLAEADARALDGALPDRAAPLAPAAVEACLAALSEQPLQEVFSELDPVPERSGLWSQQHRARLAGGELVTIEVACPEARVAAELDLPHLERLAALLADGELALEIDRVDLDDFQAYFLATTDLGRRAAGVEILRAGDQGAADWVLPRTLAVFPGGMVWVRERLAGAALAELVPDADSRSGAALRTVLGGMPRAADLGGRLCATWLGQALHTGRAPISLEPADLIVLADDRLAWAGGESLALPGGTREHLWSYVLAAAAQDPDRAVDALLAEMTPTANADAAGLRKRLRQVVPFRDGGLGAGDDLGGYLFMHWRLARAAGFRPRPHLLAFQRGLTALVLTSRPLAIDEDPLREGVERAQLMAGFGDFRQMLDPRQMGRSAEEALRMMAGLPERLDRLLNLAADGQFSIRLETREAPEEKARRTVLNLTIGLLLAMAAVALLAHYLATAEVLGVWGERLATVVLAVLGIHLLRVLGRKP